MSSATERGPVCGMTPVVLPRLFQGKRHTEARFTLQVLQVVLLSTNTTYEAHILIRCYEVRREYRAQVQAPYPERIPGTFSRWVCTCHNYSVAVEGCMPRLMSRSRLEEGPPTDHLWSHLQNGKAVKPHLEILPGKKQSLIRVIVDICNQCAGRDRRSTAW